MDRDRSNLGRDNRDYERQGNEDRNRMRPDERFAQQGLDREHRDDQRQGRIGGNEYGYGQQDWNGNGGMGRGSSNADWQRDQRSFGRDDRAMGYDEYGNQDRSRQDRFGQDRFGQDRFGQDRGGMDSGMGYGSRQDARSGQTDWGNRSGQSGITSGMGYGQQQGGGQHVGKGPKGYQRDPQRIMEEINERMTSHPHLDATEVEVRCENGEVTLTGSVTDRQQKRIAEECAEGVSGVKDVHNQIRVQAQGQQSMTSNGTQGAQMTGQNSGRQGRGSESKA